MKIYKNKTKGEIITMYQNELLDLTRQKIDLQIEKKNYNKDINDRIKLLDARIKDLVKE